MNIIIIYLYLYFDGIYCKASPSSKIVVGVAGTRDEDEYYHLTRPHKNHFMDGVTAVRFYTQYVTLKA